MKHDQTIYHDPASHADILEARFGLRVASHLHEGAQDLPHDITERLRVARLQAVERAQLQLAKQRKAVAAPPVVLSNGGGTAALGSFPGLGAPWGHEPWWAWLGSVIPLLMLVIGLLGVSQLLQEENISTVAAVDTELLADDLPPNAYSDPGFAEFLQSPAAQAEH